MVLTVSFVLSPEIGLSCLRRPADQALSAPGRADMPPLDLTPASRRQDHTTSPSASAPFVSTPFDRSRVKTRPAITCVPDAAASTASRPHVRDDGQRPSDWDGTAVGIGVIWVRREMDSFCEQGWTGQITLIRLNKSRSARRAESVQRSHQCFGWRRHSPWAQLDCRPCPRRQLPVESYQRTGGLEPRLNFQAVMSDRR